MGIELKLAGLTADDVIQGFKEIEHSLGGWQQNMRAPMSFQNLSTNLLGNSSNHNGSYDSSSSRKVSTSISLLNSPSATAPSSAVVIVDDEENTSQLSQKQQQKQKLLLQLLQLCSLLPVSAGCSFCIVIF